MAEVLSRETAVDSRQAALLLVDMQNYCATRSGGEYRCLAPAELDAKLGYYFRELETKVVPNMQRLQTACRKAGMEVMYTVIESLTKDGRDRSLDYKITGISVPRGCWDAKVIDAVAPAEDEIIIPKTSSSAFISTNIDYVLRNLSMRYLVIGGVLTDQCVESAVRDACDLGYLVTLITDACATHSRERHESALCAIKGYCRQRTTAEFLAEILKQP